MGPFHEATDLAIAVASVAIRVRDVGQVFGEAALVVPGRAILQSLLQQAREGHGILGIEPVAIVGVPVLNLASDVREQVQAVAPEAQGASDFVCRGWMVPGYSPGQSG